MGTRYEDQPPDHWAGPGSLDPTPVWKQYILVALFVVLTLVMVSVAAYSAMAVELATPPATVIGGRVVLATNVVPAVGEAPKRFGPPPSRTDGAFYLTQPEKGTIVAIKENWRPEGKPFICLIASEDPLLVGIFPAGVFTRAACDYGGLTAGLEPSWWDARGQPVRGTDQPLDRYLVSMEAGKIVVNTSRVISGVRKVPAPSDPTFR